MKKEFSIIIKLFAVLILITTAGCLPEEVEEELPSEVVQDPLPPADPPPSDPPADPPPADPPASGVSIEGGAWSLPCDDSYGFAMLQQISFVGGIYTDTLSIGSMGSTCASPSYLYQLIHRGNYSGISTASGANFHLNQTVTYAGVKVIDAATVAAYNGGSECGISNWVLNTEVDSNAGSFDLMACTGDMFSNNGVLAFFQALNNQYIDLYNINSSDQLRFGDSSGDKVNTRPTGIDESVIYSK